MTGFREGRGLCWDDALMETLKISTTSTFRTSTAHEESDKDALARVAATVAIALQDIEPRVLLELPDWNLEDFRTMLMPPASVEYNDSWLRILLRYEYEAATTAGELVSRRVGVRGRSRGRTSIIQGTKFVPLDRRTIGWRQKLSWMEGNAAAQYLLNTSETDDAWWSLNDSRVLTKGISAMFRSPARRLWKRMFTSVTLEGIDIGEMTCHCGGLAVVYGPSRNGNIVVHGTTRIYFDKGHEKDIRAALTIVCEAAFSASFIRHSPWPWDIRKSRIMQTDTWQSWQSTLEGTASNRQADNN